MTKMVGCTGDSWEHSETRQIKKSFFYTNASPRGMNFLSIHSSGLFQKNMVFCEVLDLALGVTPI